MTTDRFAVLPKGRSAVCAAGLLALALGACGGNDIVLPSEGVAASMTIVGGDKQNGSAGAPLADSLVVKVVDTKSRPVGDQTVVFQVLSGGGQVVPDTAVTNESGLASTRWVLGTADGSQSVRARAVGNGAPGSVTATFTATAGAAGASTLAAVKGDEQTATAGSPLPDSLIVKVTDQFGNPVAGVDIDWTLTGGGTVSAPTVETGNDGQAGIVRTLGPTAGQQTTIATAAGLTGSPVTFTATATVGTAGRLTLERAPSSSGQSGVALATQPQLQLRDANGNPVSRAGVAVQAQIATGPAGSSVSGGTAATDANGLATFSTLAINGTAGSYVLNFFGSQLSGVNSDPITITAGTATKLAVLQAPSATAASGDPFAQQPTIELRDAADNPVHQSGVLVTATLQGGGATLSGDNTKTTDANGVATFTDLELTGTAGTKTILFGANGVAGTTAQVTLGAGSPSVSQSSVGYSGTTIQAGGTITISVTVKDASGNPISGAAVGVNATGTGNTTAGSITGAAGTGSATFTSTVAEAKTLTVTANGVTLDTRGVTVTPAAADAAHSSLSVNPMAIVTGQEATATVTVRDQFDNAVSGASVTLNPANGLALSQAPGTSNGSGVATGKVKATAVGNGTVTATVGGGTTSPAVTVTIAQATTTTSVSVPGGDSNVGEAVTVNYSVSVVSPGSGTPGGTVTVSGGSQSCTASVSTGSCPLTFTSAGTKSISAHYNGDANYAASTSATVDHTVNALATTTTVTSSKSSSVWSESVTFTATVSASSGTPAGTVQFKSDGSNIGSGTLTNGTVAVPVSTLPVGTHTITADYTPDVGSGFAGSSGTLSGVQTVSKASVTVAIDSTVPGAPTAGSPVTVYVSVTGAPPATDTPTGTVAVAGGSGTCSITLVGGKGNCSFTPSTTGSITATYSGDPNFNPGVSGPVTIASATVPTTTVLGSSSLASTFGQSAVITATITASGTPVTTGTVQFKVDNAATGPPLALSATGTAQLNLNALLAVGPHTIVANYGGGGGFDPSSSTLTQTVQQASTTTAVSINPATITDGESAQLTAAVSSTVPISEGTVEFFDGATTLGTAPVSSGSATLAPDPVFSGAGPHSITAQYTGGTSFAPSAVSPATTLTVNPLIPSP